MTRRQSLATIAATPAAAQSPSAPKVERYVRFENNRRASWAVVQGEDLVPLSDAPYRNGRALAGPKKLSSVKLLAPADPPKVFAVGLNYKSHLGTRPAPKEPEIFYKPTTCLTSNTANIIIPPNAKNVHYEGELVIVLGKGGRNLNPVQAKAAIFGATCGNDVSERDWQNGAQKDLQWWRAKGSDTFGPIGPYLVHGANYENALLQTRLNGEVVQKQTTADLLFDCPTIVSYISKFVTLEAGDVIFTGTPGSTRKMNPGDVVEVEIDGVGLLKNTVR